MSGLINLSLRHCMELRRRIGLLCTMGGRESAEKTAGREKRDAKCHVVAVRYRRRDRWRRRSSASRCSLSQLPASLCASQDDLSLLLFPTSSRDRF